MDTGGHKVPPESMEQPYSTWTLVSTMHILKVMEHYMDTGKHKTPPECKRAPQWTLVCTRHPPEVREHLTGHWYALVTWCKHEAPR
jgi:hypothetical protein